MHKQKDTNMQQETRTELNAFDLLMQDHREIEWHFRMFEHLKRDGEDTAGTIATACAELKAHDTLVSTVFCAAVAAARPGTAVEGLLLETEHEHDAILELIERIECERGGAANAHFAGLAEHVKRHIHRQETELFPLVSQLPAFDMSAVTRALKARRTELPGFAT